MDINTIKEILPYIVAVLTAVFSGVSSYLASRRTYKLEVEKIKENNRHDLEKLMEQHKIDIDSLERAHKMEIEKLQLTYKHEIEMKEHEAGIQLGSAILTEAMKIPEVRQQIGQGVRDKRSKK